jgi:hypothetical protein
MIRFVILAIILLTPCEVLAQKLNQLPTASEVFQLRSACAALSEKLLKKTIADTARVERKLRQMDAFKFDLEDQFEQVSHYDPKSTRCYSLLRRSYSDVDPNAHRKDVYRSIVEQYFHDAQTGELLAFTRETERAPIVGGGVKREGDIFKAQKKIDAPADEAFAYIDEMMADDRK